MQHTRPMTIAVAAAPPRALPPVRLTAPLWPAFYNLALLGGGSLLWVLALQWFMLPHHILSGGLLGIAMICGHFFSFVDVGWLNLFLNLPLFWLGWRYVGTVFTLYSIFGILAFSLMAEALTMPATIAIHPLWACLGAGLLAGGGSALIFRSAGTAGGLDILVIYLRNRSRWPVGRLVMGLNGCILFAGGGLLGLQTLLYSLLFLAVCSYTIDALVPRRPAPADGPRPHGETAS